MKTNIICIHGMYVVKTGLILEYEKPIEDDEGKYSYSEEIIDVCTGIHYGFDGVIHLVGNPNNVHIEKGLFLKMKERTKRGRHSRSNNKKLLRKNQI